MIIVDGGHWQPENCEQNQRLAILIPFSKERWNHLLILLKYLHAHLISQERHYSIFVIEQLGNHFQIILIQFYV